MTVLQSSGEVVLADGQAASELLYSTLSDAVDELRLPRGSWNLSDQAAFRRDYALRLPLYEAARLASPQRSALAQLMVQGLNQKVHWQHGASSLPLAHALRSSKPRIGLDAPRSAAALPLEVHHFKSPLACQPSLVYSGRQWTGDEWAALGEKMLEQQVISTAAAESLAWVSRELLHSGSLDLRARKIVVLGAGAEMAPTRLWLEAGAQVLWLDTLPPPESRQRDERLAGSLFWPAQGVDLLQRPQEVLATMIAFADGDPLDVGLYAYAPGRAREVRLTGAMNALVDALPVELLASVTLLVSPTTPTALSAHEVSAMQARLDRRPGWERWLAAVGVLGRTVGPAEIASGAATRTVVSIQGASYQAAQYLGKILTAEVWAARKAFRVSANTAAITRTRSLEHPIFTAAFGGAAAFGIETLTPTQSRYLNGVLALADWLQPGAPMPGKVRVHGGIHTLPYPLESALRVAAAIGFVRKPGLLLGLVKK